MVFYQKQKKTWFYSTGNTILIIIDDFQMEAMLKMTKIRLEQ